MQEKSVYTLRELFDLLPIPIAELARQSNINEVTLARIRDGKQTRRSTANKLLMTLSEVYHLPLSINNVTGIHMQVNKRLEGKESDEDVA